jgi:hypothetical protein
MNEYVVINGKGKIEQKLYLPSESAKSERQFYASQGKHLIRIS